VSVPVPRTWREWLTLGVVLVGGLLTAFVVPEDIERERVLEMMLDSSLTKITILENDLEIAETWKDEYKGRLDAADTTYVEDLDAQYEICQNRHDRLWKTRAGEECYAENERLVKRLEDEKKFYHWSLKFCGAITEKTPVQIKRYEQEVEELTDQEEENMED
jgi:hypothetical protein